MRNSVRLPTYFGKLFDLYNKFPRDKAKDTIVGTYNFKDIAAHMQEWEQFLIGSLKGIQNGTIKIGKPNIKKINLEFYKKKGILVEVNGERKVEEINREILKKVK